LELILSIRKNQTKAIRITLTGTHEQMMKLQREGKLDQWIKANLSWLKDTFREKNLVSCVLHMDKKYVTQSGHGYPQMK
jgi:hypothetical protein